MPFGFYKQRTNKLVAGVLAGVADRFHWDLKLTRIIFFLICLFGRFGLLAIIIYIVAALTLPFKEDVYADRYGTGPRKVKEAEKIHRYK